MQVEPHRFEESAAARRVIEATDSRVVRLAPPVREELVATFERDHAVRLPEDYRWFVLHAGNGGVGPPYYGLEPLSDLLIEGNSFLPPEENRNSRLSHAFPGRESDWADWEPELADEAWIAHEAGRLLLGTDGCAILWVLALTGPARGEVWRLGDAAAARAGSSFLDWYAEWLERRGPRPDDPIPRALVDAPTGRLRSLVRRLRP